MSGLKQVGESALDRPASGSAGLTATWSSGGPLRGRPGGGGAGRPPAGGGAGAVTKHTERSEGCGARES